MHLPHFPHFQVLVATQSGALMVVLIHTSPSDPSPSADADAPGLPSRTPHTPHTSHTWGTHVHIRTSWEMGVLDGPVTALALNAQGDCAAAACAPKGVVAFLKVSNAAADITMQPLGFYHVKQPRLLAFAPASASAGGVEGGAGEQCGV